MKIIYIGLLLLFPMIGFTQQYKDLEIKQINEQSVSGEYYEKNISNEDKYLVMDPMSDKISMANNFNEIRSSIFDDDDIGNGERIPVGSVNIIMILSLFLLYILYLIPKRRSEKK